MQLHLKDRFCWRRQEALGMSALRRHSTLNIHSALKEVKTNFNNSTRTNLLYWWQIFWRNLYWCTHWNTNTIPKASLLKWKLINFPFNLSSSLDCKNIFYSFLFQLSVGNCQTKSDTDGELREQNLQWWFQILV